MRSDMGDVVRGRSRSWTWCAANGHLKALEKTPPEHWWTREGIRTRCGDGRSYPTERHGPACRFLGSNAGRPWDAIYSEICRELRRGSPARDRFLRVVDRYVERCVILVDGVPCQEGGHDHGAPLRNYGGRYFYVCPESGLLLRVPGRRAVRDRA